MVVIVGGLFLVWNVHLWTTDAQDSIRRQCITHRQ